MEYGNLIPRPKTCNISNRVKKKYLTCGRKIREEELKIYNLNLLNAYKIPKPLKTLEDCKNYWKKEKIEEENLMRRRKKKLRPYSHTINSKINYDWKSERLFVPETDAALPGTHTIISINVNHDKNN